MEKLPISIGIISWKSGQTLVNSLASYYKNGLVNIIDDITILFQEYNKTDIEIANHFGFNCICLIKNIGIGAAFMKLAENAKYDYFLNLEHDWHLIENIDITYERLNSGLKLIIEDNYDVVRYRHRNDPGYPHFSMKHMGNELDYYDDWHECTAPHLLDSIHWLDPSDKFCDKIKKYGEYFITTSRWGNWTNNPCLYRTGFYKDVVKPFIGEGIDLERKIAYWWPRQNFKIAHGEGLFKHIDLVKYGK